MAFSNKAIIAVKLGNIEFVTTTKYIEEALKPGDYILDIGAGTGVYSFYFANLGYNLISGANCRTGVDSRTETAPLC